MFEIWLGHHILGVSEELDDIFYRDPNLTKSIVLASESTSVLRLRVSILSPRMKTIFVLIASDPEMVV